MWRPLPIGLLAGIVSSGCREATTLYFSPSSDTRTVLLAIEVDDLPIRLESLSPEVSQFELGSVGQGQVTLLEYNREPLSLQLPFGSIPIITDGKPGRVLPEPTQSWRSRVATEILSGFVQTPLPDAIATLRIAPFDYIPCGEAGGCLNDVDDEYCTLPCEREAPLPPTPPAEPNPPSWRPCPTGWNEEIIEGAETCRPPRPIACSPGEAFFMGASGCVLLGEACAPWPSVPQGSIYVQVGASGGDGTIARPLGSLEEAVLAAADGQVIALAPGLYASAILDRPVSIVGACAGTVEIASLIVTGSNVHVRSVTIGSVDSAVAVTAGGTLTLEESKLRDATHCLTADLGSRAEIHRSLFESCGSGITTQGATVALTTSTMLQMRQLGISALDGSVVTATGLMVEAGSSGDGVVVSSGAHAVLEQVGVWDAVTGLSVQGDLVAHSAYVSGTENAVAVSDGELRLSFGHLERWRHFGALCSRGRLSLLDTVIIRAEATTQEDRPITLSGGVGTLERVWLVGPSSVGIGIADGARLDAADVRARFNGTFAGYPMGLQVQSATASVERAAFMGYGRGIVIEAGSSVGLSDIAYTAFVGSAKADVAITSDSSTLSISRLSATGPMKFGIEVERGGATASDLDISGFTSRGIKCDNDCEDLTLRRVQIRDGAGQGFECQTPCQIDVEDLRISGVIVGDCNPCGGALFLADDPVARVRRFELSDAEGGLVIILDAPLARNVPDLSEGIIQRNTVGLVLPSSDLAPFFVHTLIRENATPVSQR